MAGYSGSLGELQAMHGCVFCTAALLMDTNKCCVHKTRSATDV